LHNNSAAIKICMDKLHRSVLVSMSPPHVGVYPNHWCGFTTVKQDPAADGSTGRHYKQQIAEGGPRSPFSMAAQALSASMHIIPKAGCGRGIAPVSDIDILLHQPLVPLLGRAGT
jgi:hypothetical protein